MNRFAFDNSSILIPDFSNTLASGYNPGVNSFVFQDVENFSSDGYVIFEILGQPRWEILKINTINSGTNTVTTTTTSKFAHEFGIKVYYSRYNQVRLYRSTNTTTTGSLVTTKTIDGANVTDKGEKITVLEDSTNTSGYAYFVLCDSVGDVQSTEFSAPIPYRLETNTLRYVRDIAFRQLRKQSGSVLNDELIIDLANQCSQDIRDMRRKFSDLNDLEDSLGNLVEGQWKYALPTDIHSQVTNNSIYALRLLGEMDLQWVDKIEWNERMYGFVYSQVATEATFGATTLAVRDGSVFDADGGTVYVGSDEVAYTGVSGNTLTGVSGITTTHAVDTFVFDRGVQRGKPNIYTVIDSALYLYPVPDEESAGMRLMIDYDKDVTPITAINDTLPFPAILYIHYIKAGMLETESYGEPTQGSTRERGYYESRKRDFFQVDPRVKRNSMTPSLYAKKRGAIRTSRTRVKNW